MRTLPNIRPGAFKDPEEREEIKKLSDHLRQVSGGLSRSIFPGQTPSANPVPSSSSPGGTSGTPHPVQGDMLYGLASSAWARLPIGSLGQFLTVGSGAAPVWSSTIAAFPVGSVFIAVVSTNPSTLLGYGTWSAFGAGRVLVGLNSGDVDFDTVEETGGAKTIASAGTVSTIAASDNATGVEGGTGANPSDSSHEHPAPTYTGTATSVVQPYIVVYMWKRTA